MFKNKRGVSIDKLFLIESILILVVCVGMIVYVNNVFEETHFEKRIVVRDLSLTINTIESVPGNVYYWYTPKIDIKDYDFKFFDNLVLVSEKIVATLGYPFFYNGFLKKYEIYTIFKVKNFTISKFNDILVISPESRFGLKDKLVVAETPSEDYQIILPPVDDEENDDEAQTDEQDNTFPTTDFSKLSHICFKAAENEECDDNKRVRKIAGFYAGPIPTKKSGYGCSEQEGRKFLTDLKALGITTVVDLACGKCSKEYLPLLQEFGMDRIDACMDNDKKIELDGAAWAEVKNTLSAGNTYLHCYYGRHRATTVIQRWLIETQGRGCKETLELSKSGASALNNPLAEQGYFNNYGKGIELDENYNAVGTGANFHAWVMGSDRCKIEFPDFKS